MKKASLETGLGDSIIQLERKRAVEEKLLREQFHLTIDSMKPINLIKSTFKDAVESQDFKKDIISTSVGLTAGYLSKIVFQGVMNTPLKKLLGSLLMFGITNVVARNPETVKSLAKGAFKMIRGKQNHRLNGTTIYETKEIIF
jgi:hypothetical protein